MVMLDPNPPAPPDTETGGDKEPISVAMTVEITLAADRDLPFPVTQRITVFREMGKVTVDDPDAMRHDCQTLIGYFLEHSPGALFKLLARDSEMRQLLTELLAFTSLGAAVISDGLGG